VEYLLERGAQLEAREEENGTTPLHCVAEGLLSNTYFHNTKESSAK
jgi:hypothetical protein